MAITVVNSSSAIQGISAASATSSPTFTSTTGNLLIAVGVLDTVTTFGATPYADGGTNTWSHSASGTAGTDPELLDIAFAKNITGKAGEAVTITASAATGFPGICLIEVSGCDTTSPNDVAQTYSLYNTAAGSFASPLITPAAGAHIIVAGGVNGVGQAVTDAGSSGIGTGAWTTILNNGASGEPFLLAYAIVTADGVKTYGINYTVSPNANSAVVGIAAFKAAAGGGATPIKPPMRTLRGAGL